MKLKSNALEELIASKVRIRMVRVWATEPIIHVTDFLNKVGCKSGEGYRNIRLFVEAGVAKEAYDKDRNSRILYFLVDNPRAKLLLKIVKLLSEDEDEDIIENKPKGIVVVNKAAKKTSQN